MMAERNDLVRESSDGFRGYVRLLRAYSEESAKLLEQQFALTISFWQLCATQVLPEKTLTAARDWELGAKFRQDAINAVGVAADISSACAVTTLEVLDQFAGAEPSFTASRRKPQVKSTRRKASGSGTGK